MLMLVEDLIQKLELLKNSGFIPVKQVYIDPRIDIAIVKINPKLIPKQSLEAKLKCDKVSSGTSVAASTSQRSSFSPLEALFLNIGFFMVKM